jgi:hypothetical protein
VDRDDGSLEHYGWQGAWQSDNLGGILTTSPSAASWGASRLDVFALGTDDSLFHIAWDGTRWSSWEARGGSYVPSPEVVARQANRLDVFALGEDGDVLRISWDGAQWGTAQPLMLLSGR